MKRLMNLQRTGSLVASLALSASCMMTLPSMAVAAEAKKDNGFLEKMDRWQEQMSDKFRDTWKGLRGDSKEKSVSSASADLREDKDRYTLRLNLPDRDLEKVQIKLEDDTLRIVAPAEDKAGRYEQSVALSGVVAGAERDVTQLQVNERQGLTYAEGVKGLLRLDPDILMMGEMRDANSARAALDAADSGHVFLSTLHARDAAGTISVLRHFGLTDHEIATTLDLLVAQRLVRRLCFSCRRPEPPTPHEAQWLRMCHQPVPDKTWRAVGCPKCGGSGYAGRIGVFEIHRLKESDADLILSHADEHTLRRHLRGRGSLSMVEDDLQKVAEGVTTIEEFQAVGGMGFFARATASGAEANTQRTHRQSAE